MNVTLLNADWLKENFFKQWGETSCVCYNSPVENAEKIGKQCLKSGHYSGSRDIPFRFKIEGVSRSLSLQLNRHEVGISKNQQSQRYVDESNFDYFTPTSVNGKVFYTQVPIPTWDMDGSGEIINVDTPISLSYQDMVNIIKSFYKTLRNFDIPQEDARYILPEAIHTQGVYSFSFEALINFCHKRLCTRSQAEIRELARLMKNLATNTIPELNNYLTPICDYLHRCPESKSCGRYKNE